MADHEESRKPFGSRERFRAEFTLSGQSEILRCAQDDSEALGMIRQVTDSQRFFSMLLSQTFSPASKYDLSRMAKLPASYKLIDLGAED